jgi:hypothetical protein
MAHGTVNGQPMTTSGQEDYQRREVEEQEATRQRAEALVRRIGKTCDELERLAEENPGLVARVARGAEEQKDAYLRLKARLRMADMAPRCRWVRQDGTSCRSPQMKQHIYCFAHKQMAEARTLLLLLPPPEDANAIQVGLMRIQKAMIEDTISTKKAGLLLYSMQLALTNVGQTTFGKAKDEEMVRDTVDEEEALSEEARSSRHSVFSQEQELFTAKDTKYAKESEQNQHQNQRPFTAEGTEENQGLPLINTDDADGKRKEAFGIQQSAFSEKQNPRHSGMTWDAVGDRGRGVGIAGIVDMAVIGKTNLAAEPH